MSLFRFQKGNYVRHILHIFVTRIQCEIMFPNEIVNILMKLEIIQKL